jgi:hypothetical protein
MMSDQEMSKHDHVLAGLMFSLQAAAMQQLGKIQDPMTGEVNVDLDQARSTIDVLEMLKAKCRTDTPDDLLRALDGAVMDLQLNFMEESKKSRQTSEEKPAEEETSNPADTASEDPPSASDA